jgi:hypothetical protein
LTSVEGRKSGQPASAAAFSSVVTPVASISAGGVVVPLDPRVEQVRHGEGQTRQHDEDDGDPVE